MATRSTKAAKPKTEAQTEPKTEPKTEPQTEPKTEPQTEPKTEAQTEPKTEPQTEPKTEPVILTVVAPYGLNLRRTPNFHSAVLEVLKDGQSLEVRPVEEEIPAGWKPVKAGDQDGWVYDRYVKE